MPIIKLNLPEKVALSVGPAGLFFDSGVKKTDTTPSQRLARVTLISDPKIRLHWAGKGIKLKLHMILFLINIEKNRKSRSYKTRERGKYSLNIYICVCVCV